MLLLILKIDRNNIHKNEPVLAHEIGDEKDLHDEAQYLDQVTQHDLQPNKNQVLVCLIPQDWVLERFLLFLLYVSFDHWSELLHAHRLMEFLDSPCLHEPHKLKSLIERAKDASERQKHQQISREI